MHRKEILYCILKMKVKKYLFAYSLYSVIIVFLLNTIIVSEAQVNSIVCIISLHIYSFLEQHPFFSFISILVNN